MKQNALSIAALVVALAAAFVAGRGTLGPTLAAQDPGSRAPAIPPGNPVTITAPKPETLMYSEDNGGAASANGFLAVTGSYGVGTSVLYVIDTVTKQLAVYEARGGARTMRRLSLVGARRIDLDLQLRGYNDESEFSYGELEKMFGSRHPPAPAVQTPGATEATAERR